MAEHQAAPSVASRIGNASPNMSSGKRLGRHTTHVEMINALEN